MSQETHDACYLSALTLLTNSIYHNNDIIKQRSDMCRLAVTQCQSLRTEVWGCGLTEHFHTQARNDKLDKDIPTLGDRGCGFSFCEHRMSHTHTSKLLFI